MTRIKNIIEELKTETSLPVEDEVIAIRLVKSQRPVSIFIGWNPSTEITSLYILLEKKLKRSLMESFPIWKGASVEQVQLSIPVQNHYNKWFLKLSHQSKEDIKIFEAIIENICEVLIGLVKYEEMIPALQIILEQWRVFFTNYGKEGLSDEAQQGLYGEIWLLRELLKKNPSLQIINGWTGPERKPHDYQLYENTIEVKTIASKKPYKIHVSNELQFETAGTKNLYLIVLILLRNENGESLSEIIDRVKEIIKNDYLGLTAFNSKLFLAGYLEEHRELYTKGFGFLGGRAYKVEEGFPRIDTRSLLEGIGDVKYTVSLAACEDYKKNFSETIDEIALNKVDI